MAEDFLEERQRVISEFKKLWKTGHPEFYNLLVKMGEIHEIKSKGYDSPGNPLSCFFECERFGIPAWKGCLVRMSDKINRIYNLATKVEDSKYTDTLQMESLEDTLLDLANYSLFCLILLRRVEDDVS